MPPETNFSDNNAKAGMILENPMRETEELSMNQFSREDKNL